MKILILISVISFNLIAQIETINCDSIIFSEKGMADVWYEKMPELIGGLDSLQSRLIYPPKAEENKIEGKVYVIVVIDSTGDQLCARVIKSLGYGCDEEALRLIQTSKFLPGVHLGKHLAMKVSIPIVFSLTDEKKE
jgi:protein TonB